MSRSCLSPCRYRIVTSAPPDRPPAVRSDNWRDSVFIKKPLSRRLVEDGGPQREEREASPASTWPLCGSLYSWRYATRLLLRHGTYPGFSIPRAKGNCARRIHSICFNFSICTSNVMEVYYQRNIYFSNWRSFIIRRNINFTHFPTKTVCIIIVYFV